MQPASKGGEEMSSSILQRTSTRVLIAWTIVAGFLAFLVYRHNQQACETSFFGQNACEAAGVAPSFWQPFFVIWLIGLVVGAIVWAAIKPTPKGGTR
jgi:H+/Cl- antiporter ClcA